jgi:ABC-type phosphate/phosphonate transport system substrate-binding protein
MYAYPQTAPAIARFWTLIRNAYGAGDADLTHYQDLAEAWSDPGLMLSQTCGLPYRYLLKDKVNLVGTPDYGVRGCPPGYYRSCLVARRDDPRRALHDFRDTPFARNSHLSQSGWAAVESHLAETGAGLSFRDNLLETGGHAASVRAVAEGRAGLASIDAVTWRFLKRYEPAAQNLRVVALTRPTPGLPFVTGKETDPKPLFQAVETAIIQLKTRDRRALGLKGIVWISPAAYLAEPLPYPLEMTASA